MNTSSKLALALTALAWASQAGAQVTLYEHVNFGGQSYTASRQVDDFSRTGFNDRASSVVVSRDNWEFCDDAGFGGRCVVLRPGNYPDLRALGLNDTISSMRMAAAAPAPSAGRVTFYEDEGFGGRSFSTDEEIDNFSRIGFNDRAASIVVERANWQVCENSGFGGRCMVLREGRYGSLSEMGLNDRISSVRMVAAAPAPTAARVTFYEYEGFRGRSFTTDEPIDNFWRTGFNDRASSIVVERANWQVCENSGFGGRCVVLREGRYASLTEMGLNDRISSLRVVDPNSYGRPVANSAYRPAPGVDYRQRNNERLYQAEVTDVRAVLGTPEQRCWVERGQVSQERGEANLPGALIGAVLGGVIGHQVGAGFGKDIATIGGVAAGAAVGANVGRDRNGQPVATQDVRRCETVAGQARADYWDVTYSFRGRDHRMQMTRPPGPTITVNRDGEPRV